MLASWQNETSLRYRLTDIDNETVDVRTSLDYIRTASDALQGVEFPQFPKRLEARLSDDQESVVVADMSSNFLSRKVDVSKYAVVFGGAQKNIGVTGVTLVIVRKDILSVRPTSAFLHAVGIWSPPVVLDWPVIAKNNSLYNSEMFLLGFYNATANSTQHFRSSMYGSQGKSCKVS